MEIIDDGKGFDMADVKRGLGLTNIMNRAELFNGRANIVASPDKGCTVTVTVPLLQSNKIRA
jgi:two-component system sensor histidine kinase UhpB